MINKEVVAKFLNRELDNFLWMKKLKVEDFHDDFKKWKVKPHFKTTPWVHQLVSFKIAKHFPNFMFLNDMGTGKTKSILDIITQVQREGKLKRALVTVNSQLTIDSWRNAIEVHSDLHPILVVGSIEEKWENLIAPAGDIAVIDYHGLHLALAKKIKQGKKTIYIKDDAKIKQIKKLYNFFNADESQKVKKGDTLRYAILNAVTQHMDYRYCMTGTPMGRNPEDVFSQFYLADRGETFGTTLGMFREAFFNSKPGIYGGTEYTFDKRKEQLFHGFMQHRSLRYTEDECSDIPARNNLLLKLDFTSEQREHYLQALEGFINTESNMLELANAFFKLRQILSGYIHWKDDTGEHLVRFRSNPKMEMLESLLESSDGKFVVFYDYTQTGKLITDRLKELNIKCSWAWGGGKDNIGTVDRFKTDSTTRVLVVQNEVGSAGVDGLQDVSRYMVFFESPCSPITRRQAEKRLHRSGQSKRVFIYDLVIGGSMDVRVLEFIKEGKDLHEALVEGKLKNKNRLLMF